MKILRVIGLRINGVKAFVRQLNDDELLTFSREIDGEPQQWAGAMLASLTLCDRNGRALCNSARSKFEIIGRLSDDDLERVAGYAAALNQPALAALRARSMAAFAERN